MTLVWGQAALSSRVLVAEHYLPRMLGMERVTRFEDREVNGRRILRVGTPRISVLINDHHRLTSTLCNGATIREGETVENLNFTRQTLDRLPSPPHLLEKNNFDAMARYAAE